MANGMKIGLALGGGAALAFSHIGVIAGLVKHRIPIDIVTGTSMGAVIGAMYATHPDVGMIRQIFAEYINSKEYADSGLNFFKELDSHDVGILSELAHKARRGVFNTLMITKTALINDKTAARSYAYLIDDINVEQTRIPFAAVALDLLSGESVILDRGRLRDVVAASCAMPGVLSPVELDSRLLVDGGWTETVPINAARHLGADFVIAVEVADSLKSYHEPRNALDVIARADSLARNALNREQLKAADLVISPQNGIAHWADFTTAVLAIDLGEEEVDRQIGGLHHALRKMQQPAWFDWGGRWLFGGSA